MFIAITPSWWWEAHSEEQVLHPSFIAMNEGTGRRRTSGRSLHGTRLIWEQRRREWEKKKRGEGGLGGEAPMEPGWFEKIAGERGKKKKKKKKKKKSHSHQICGKQCVSEVSVEEWTRIVNIQHNELLGWHSQDNMERKYIKQRFEIQLCCFSNIKAEDGLTWNNFRNVMLSNFLKEISRVWILTIQIWLRKLEFPSWLSG